MREAIADSDALVARLLAVDALVVGTPIYNFGMPSTLKAFFDHVSRNGRTFVADETGMRGLLGHRKAAIFIAAGGSYGPGEMFDGLDCLTPHLTAILGFMGVSAPDIVAARPMMFSGPKAADASMARAKAEAERLVAKWVP
jgi:FMN-dependent NADH-azoreductase